jgi:hypothetical protein
MGDTIERTWEPTTRVWRRWKGHIILYLKCDRLKSIHNVTVDYSERHISWYEEGTDDLIGAWSGDYLFEAGCEEDLEKCKCQTKSS